MQGPYNPYLNAYMQALQQQFNQPQQTQMTMPTIHADIIQVAGREDVDRYSIGAGNSQMFITRDDSTIYVKSGTANGFTLDIYDKRPPASPAPVIDPQTYVTREEFEALRGAILAAKEGA